MGKQYDVFISYRRDGGEYTARVLHETLQNQGYRVFFDVEALQAGNFNTMLYSVIEECRDFLLVLSPGALDRCANEGDWVRNEIEHALKHGKNIVPVLLRGFEFPAELPESIDQVRYKNGLQASNEHFDGFIAKLKTFLSAKPILTERIVQSKVYRRLIPALLALLILAGCAMGVGRLLQREDAVFPKSAQEKSVTSEVVYYVSLHLNHLDLMAGCVDRALQSTTRYLTTGSENYRTVQEAYKVAVKMMADTDLDAIAPDADFLGRVGALDRQPFSVADLTAMHDAMVMFRSEWLNNRLDYILWVTDPSTIMTVEDRMHSLEVLQRYFAEYMEANAYQTNELLLPITDADSLSDFKQKTLPALKYVPLTAASWINDKDVLLAEEERCEKNMEACVLELTGIAGSGRAEVESSVQELMKGYMQVYSLTSEEARKLVNAVLTVDDEKADEYLRLAEKRAKYLPREGEDEEVLWQDLAELVTLGLYDDALRCLDMLTGQAAAADQDAAKCLTAVRMLLKGAKETGVNYGTQVYCWAAPDKPHEVYEIGDIIIALNGEPCRTYMEYVAAKSALAEEEFQVTVLRLNEAGQLEPAELTLNTNMTPVYLRTLSTYGYDAM